MHLRTLHQAGMLIPQGYLPSMQRACELLHIEAYMPLGTQQQHSNVVCRGILLAF